VTDDLQTHPDASPAPLADTDPAPPMTFGSGPRETARVAIPDDGLTNGAGEIVNLVHGGIGGSVSVLWSHAGSFRASHYHKEDSHRLFVLEGEVRYYERAVGASKVELEEVFTGGDCFDTPPGREHIMLFVAPTIMISMSSRSRTHEEHEADVVRVPRESWDV
jgi:hypothetical protein